MAEKTQRDLVEEILLREFEHVRPFTPEEHLTVARYKDGSYGLSSLAFALYSNGHNRRGKSSRFPYGLLFEDGESIFSIGYYRKEHDPATEDGYIVLVAPRGKEVGEKVHAFADMLLRDGRIPCKGVYVRFLTLEQYLPLLNKGFSPAKESPWHPESPEEDETLSHSIIPLDALLSTCQGVVDVNPQPGLPPNSRRHARDAYNRALNLIHGSGCTYELRPYHPEDRATARWIIWNHLTMLADGGKAVSSTPEDYENMVDPALLEQEGMFAYLGSFDSFGISLFVGEQLTPERSALYTSISQRDPRLVYVSMPPPETTCRVFSALPTFGLIEMLAELQRKGYKEVHLGGSELSSLNKFKRCLGARPDQTYWAVKLR